MITDTASSTVTRLSTCYPAAVIATNNASSGTLNARFCLRIVRQREKSPSTSSFDITVD